MTVENMKGIETFHNCASRTQCRDMHRHIRGSHLAWEVREALFAAIEQCHCDWWRDHLAGELRLWRKDLTPAQCWIGRSILDQAVCDLAVSSGVDATDIHLFEAGDSAANLTIGDRSRLWGAFQNAGVTFSQNRRADVIRIGRKLSERLAREPVEGGHE